MGSHVRSLQTIKEKDWSILRKPILRTPHWLWRLSGTLSRHCLFFEASSQNSFLHREFADDWSYSLSLDCMQWTNRSVCTLYTYWFSILLSMPGEPDYPLRRHLLPLSVGLLPSLRLRGKGESYFFGFKRLVIYSLFVLFCFVYLTWYDYNSDRVPFYINTMIIQEVV